MVRARDTSGIFPKSSLLGFLGSSRLDGGRGFLSKEAAQTPQTQVWRGGGVFKVISGSLIGKLRVQPN